MVRVSTKGWGGKGLLVEEQHRQRFLGGMLCSKESVCSAGGAQDTGDVGQE